MSIDRGRRNPHAIGYLGPNGLRRIDRLNAGAGDEAHARTTARSAATPEKPLHRVESPAFHVVVVPDLVGGRLTDHDRDVLGLAQQLANVGEPGAVVAVTFGEVRQTGFEEAGVDRLLRFDGPGFDGYSPEPRLAALQAAEAGLVPRYWLFPDSAAGGGELGRRLAARLGERPATQAWRVDPQRAVSRADGGRSDIGRDTPRVLLAAVECADPVGETRHEALPVTLEEPHWDMRQVVDDGEFDADPATVPLAEAEFILSAGNGVRDWELFHHTAGALGAAVGASRVAVDDGHMPRARQVGATGTLVTARVYVAVGISGAIQHMQGIGKCDKVVAINRDADCDMVRRADLGVIGDSTAILRALVELAEQPRKEEQHDAA